METNSTKQNGINVLSLFDGISVAQLALSAMGITVKNYYASEIDTKAISVTSHHFPDTIQLGDVKQVDTTKLPEIDLLIFGSPCQDMSSINKNRKGLAGEKSSLFHDAVRILNEIKPKYFLMENVASMSKTDRNEISKILGVEPIKINSNLLTAQHRSRYYWTNISGITQPQDLGIKLNDILVNGHSFKEKANCITTRQLSLTPAGLNRYLTKSIGNLVFYDDDVAWWVKEGTLDISPKLCKGCQHYPKYWTVRNLLIVEAERLQGLPDGYVGDILKTSAATHALGNSFTMPIIRHILSFADFK